MQVDIVRLQQLVEDGFLTCRPHPTADLVIWNYTARCQYERYWTPETMMCRGLITKIDGTIVARPFKKFFNLEEYQGELPLEPFTVTTKMDGSLGILYFVDGKPYLATRGSFTGWHAERANAILQRRYQGFRFLPQCTYLFEIIFPENRIVIDYGDMEDLVLLTVIHTELDEEFDIRSPWLINGWPFPVVQRYDGITDIAALRELEEANKEGFVIRFESGLRLKLKFAEYKRLHSILTGTSTKTIWEALAIGASLADLFSRVPDEFAGWAHKVAGELTEAKNAWVSKALDEYAKMPKSTDRKTFALEAVKSPMRAALFALLDGKPIDEMAWKAVKPEFARPFRIDVDTI